MSAGPAPPTARPPAGLAAVPRLRFSVLGGEAAEHAAVPTLTFALRIEVDGAQPIRSVLLDVSVNISARERGYGPGETERLLELFGTPERWGTTLRTLPWLHTTVIVPPFAGSAVADVRVPCTYDFEVTAARYLAGLGDGEVPLEFLFSGSVFYGGEQGQLQTARIHWDAEARYRLPVSAWRRAIDRHFPGSAWLRLGRERFDRLCAFKAQGAFLTWDDAIDALLDGAGRDRP